MPDWCDKHCVPCCEQVLAPVKSHTNVVEYVPLVWPLVLQVLRYVPREVQMIGIEYMSSVGDQGVGSVGH